MKAFSAPLNPGARGQDVADLHKLLIGLGYTILSGEMRDQRFGPSTQRAVQAFLASHKMESPDGTLTPEALKMLEQSARSLKRVVRGVVRLADDTPVAGVTVIAFDRDFRSRQVLGKDVTDRLGRYRVTYDHLSFARAERLWADIGIEIHDREHDQEKETPLYRTAIADLVMQAGPDTEIDAVLKSAPAHAQSEYESLVEAVSALIGDTPVAQIGDGEEGADEAQFLARETGYSFDRLIHLIAAHRAGAISRIEPAFFYALLREDGLSGIGPDRPRAVPMPVDLDTDPKAILFEAALLDEDKCVAAVKRAVRRRIVPAKTAEMLAETLKLLAKFRKDAEAYVQQSLPLRAAALIEDLIADGKAEDILTLMKGIGLTDIAALRERLGAGLLRPDAGKKVEGRLRLAELLDFNLGTAQAAIEKMGIETPEDVRALAKLERKDWSKLIERPAGKGKSRGAPVDPAHARRQASVIVRRFERAFPTTALAAQLARSKSAAIADAPKIAAFLDAHPDLELKTHRIRPFLKEKGVAIAGSGEEAVIRQTEAVQRVFRLSGTYKASEALMAAGYSASADIMRVGRARFTADAKQRGIAEAQADAIYATAQNTHYATVSLATNLRLLGNPAPYGGGGTIQLLSARLAPVLAEYPDLTSLFGRNDAAECSHCRSVYGPAAYMSAVMRFLRDRLVIDGTAPGGPSTKSGLDILLARRPDLADIDLDCNNALIAIPQIDYVAELLEETIAPDPGFVVNGAVVAGTAPAAIVAAVRAAGYDVTDKPIFYGPHAPNRFVMRDERHVFEVKGPGPNWTFRRLRQTHGTIEERSASPEYVNNAAYDLLRTGKTAFTLPFDLHHTQARAYLSAAGVERATLMETFAVGGNPGAAIIAGEVLGLSAAERALIFAPSVADQPAIWAVPGVTATPQMRRMDVFLAKTGLEYRDAEALIAGAFVRGNLNLFIKHTDLSPNLATKTINALNDTALDRIHRVLRLARRSGLPVADIDRLARAANIGGNALGTPALIALAKLVRLSGDLLTPVGSLVTWLTTIPTTRSVGGEVSEHARLFENPAATGPLDPRLSVAGLAANEAAETAIPGSGARLSVFAADLATAFGITGGDVQLLIGRISEAGVLGANPPLTFRALAMLYGRIGLARALGVTLADLVMLERLVPIDPLANTANLEAFVSAARKVEKTGVAIPDLGYRLARRPETLAGRDLAEDRLTAMLSGLRADVLAAIAANRSPYDDTLSAIEQLPALEAMLQREPGLSDPSIASLLDLVRLDVPSVAAGNAAKAIVSGPLATRVDAISVNAAIDGVVAAPGDGAARKLLLRRLMDGLAATATTEALRAAAIAAVAAFLSVPEDIASVVLDGTRLLTGGNSLPPMRLLTTGSIADPLVVAITPAGNPDLYRALRVVEAALALAAPFAASADTLAYHVANAAALGWMRLDDGPWEAGRPSVALARWQELADVLMLFRDRPARPVAGSPGSFIGPKDVFSLTLAAGTTAALLDMLAIVTGWPRDLLGEADTWFGHNRAAYRLPAIWESVGRAVEALRSLRVPLAEAVSFTAETLDANIAAATRRMLRARYSDAEWLPALGALMNPIREAKRDALVAYVMATNPALASINDLYDSLLIDTQWSAKMPTSRIVQAHGTLQLFITRCLAGLEPTARADLDADPDWSWWSWMKNYRVWEVNLKVNFEAQYYIRPAWRDDKTEPFLTLEQGLQQTEIGEESVADAFEGYLDVIDDIAFLDVLTTCYDFEREEMHVFAATKGGEPRVYYHRILQRERVWTPWTKIDLDIAGDHLIAFFRNERLYLAWLMIKEVGREDGSSQMPDTPPGQSDPVPQPERRLEMQLAVSEYTGKSWRPRRMSPDSVNTEWSRTGVNRSQLLLTVNPDPDHFAIEVFRENDDRFYRFGRYLLTGCKGYPEANQAAGGIHIVLPGFKDTALRAQRYRETNRYPGDDLAIAAFGATGGYDTLFGLTPGQFRVTYPFQASEFDRILTMFLNLAGGSLSRDMTFRFFGTLMPFFFEDNLRGYVLTPGFYGRLDRRTQTRDTVKTFSNIRRFLIDLFALFTKYIRLYAAATTPAQRDAVTDAFATDPEPARLRAEFESYRGTQFGYVVRNFYHPLACFLRQTFFAKGVSGLLKRSTQLEIGDFVFQDATNGYAPTSRILKPYPKPEIEFSRESAYGVYNWELFFHIPHLIATQLIEAERFDEALTWLATIFDPLGTSSEPAPQRYWNTKPFYERDPLAYAEEMISAILTRIAADPGGAIETELLDGVLEWRRNPFKPYLIARQRTIVFQQAIVDLTIRALIGRADAAFRKDTMEDIIMAALDYSRAERLLGPRPKIVPPVVPTPPETYAQLAASLDTFGNALRGLENLMPDLSGLPQGGSELPPLPVELESLYFCIPPSEKLYELWDLVEDRQFKLRNSLTIDGVERSLALFAPPLSVEALIQAAAGGMSVSAILAALGAPRPPYKFRVLIRQAIELAERATDFSRQLQAAMASADAEGLARLKAAQTIELLKAQEFALKQELEIAGHSLDMAGIVRKMHDETKRFYDERPYMNAWEIAATAAYSLSLAGQVMMAIGYIASGGLKLIPKFMIGAAGFGGSPTANAQTGGDQIGDSARDLMVKTMESLITGLEKAGSMLERQGQYQVRKEDWEHTAKIAGIERDRADVEIKIAEIRKKIAKDALSVHGVREQQAAAEETYLKSKFTNKELYDWMASTLRALSKRMYKLAMEQARAAERCYRFELGVTDSFIRPGLWNDARRGFLAAEELMTDLKRMEASYLKSNFREQEMTRHISLARLDPQALLELRNSGRCTIQIPEALFDLDAPGQYFRRIRALSVSVPCVAGPYVSVPLKLTQTSNRIRILTSKKPGAGLTDAQAYAEDPGNDTRFSYTVGAVQSVTLSRGDDDAGLFALDLNDERYLPFEGSGAIGTFVLELPADLRVFDYNTITDVVLHLRYTARDGGGGFRTLVANGLRANLEAMVQSASRVGLFQAFDLKRDRPALWSQLVATGATQVTITRDDLPYFTRQAANAITAIRVIAKVKGAPASYDIGVNGAALTLSAPGEAGLAGLLSGAPAPFAFDAPVPLSIPLPSLIEEYMIVIAYNLTPP
ncbi:MAG: neuraminidase-like domain-containing protein [Beijerinckiaceae bacterium]|jgi:hypothetical protein|nr:neuraminidase-like domain-containing protein [Beijerinckiaceae bacterium]